MKREAQIIIRVTDVEKESFEKAADIVGVGLSAWARQKLRSASIKDLQDVGEKVPFLMPVKNKNQNGN